MELYEVQFHASENIKNILDCKATRVEKWVYWGSIKYQCTFYHCVWLWTIKRQLVGEVHGVQFERQEAVFESNRSNISDSPAPWDLVQSSSIIEHIWTGWMSWSEVKGVLAGTGGAIQVSSRSVTMKRLTVGRHRHQLLASFNQNGFLNKFSYGKAFHWDARQSNSEDSVQTGRV